MTECEISVLKDLKMLRTAPILDIDQSKGLFNELSGYMNDADWFTIGIMAPSAKHAVFILKEMENRFNWSPAKVVSKPIKDGPVFLKANQKTGDIHIRIEYGLGEGILIGCQHNEEHKETETLGPFPLDFFKIKDE